MPVYYLLTRASAHLGVHCRPMSGDHSAVRALTLRERAKTRKRRELCLGVAWITRVHSHGPMGYVHMWWYSNTHALCLGMMWTVRGLSSCVFLWLMCSVCVCWVHHISGV